VPVEVEQNTPGVWRHERAHRAESHRAVAAEQQHIRTGLQCAADHLTGDADGLRGGRKILGERMRAIGTPYLQRPVAGIHDVAPALAQALQESELPEHSGRLLLARSVTARAGRGADHSEGSSRAGAGHYSTIRALARAWNASL
jgi:hypothetical protein